MYVSLHNQTHYSILDALSSPEELFDKAVSLGMTSIAVTDHGTFASVWECFKLAKKKKIKLIVGCEYFFKRDPNQTHFNHVILLAKNAEGYRNMLSLNFDAFANSPAGSKKKYPVVSWELLEKYSAGTICLTACGAGILAESIMENKPEQLEQDLTKLINIFGKDNLGIEIQANNLKRFAGHVTKEIDQNLINRQLIKLAEKHELRIVPSCNSHYVNKEDHETHDVQLAIGSGMSVFSKFRLKYDLPEFYLKSEEEIKKFFSRNFGKEFADKIVDNTVYFSDLCEEPEWVDPKFTNPSGKELPEYPVKDADDYQEFLTWLKNKPEIALLPAEDMQYLRFRVDKGLHEKNLQNNLIYLDRLAEEFDVIEFRGFSSYILIVMDYINYAHNKGISIGPGRGCLKGDTQVLSEKGFKNLKDIKEGDKVYTHTGKLKSVLTTFKFDIPTEKVIRIKSDHSYNDLVMTKDHKVYSYKSVETKKYKEKAKDINCKILHKYRRYEDPGVPSWNEAEKLKVGDLIYTTLPKRVVEPNIILKKYEIKVASIKNGKPDKLIEINIDNNFLYFLGRFTGDGWLRGSEDQPQTGSYGVGLAFNSNDTDGVEYFKKYFTDLGILVYTYKHNNKDLIQMFIHSKDLMLLVKSFFPDYKSTSGTKHLPSFFRELNNDQLKYLLNGLIDSDGSKKEKDSKKELSNRWCVDSTSLKLILEVKEALILMGVKSSIKTREEFMRGKYLCNKSYKLRFKKSDFDNENPVGFYSKISSLTEESIDSVYDIMVDEDHSYLTTNGIVHNSIGGCLIAYLTDIHQADPIEYDLVFARFQNKSKQALPDIDVDISSNGREQIKEYLTSKYKNTAAVSNIGTITTKVYTRDIARAFELGGSKESAVVIGNSIADSVDKDDKSIDKIESGLFDEFAKKYPELLNHKQLVSKPRSWSSHAAGAVIGKRPLKGLVPLRIDKDGQICLEFTKDDAEEVGLVKMDLLGLKTLDIIDLTYELINKNNKQIANPIPLDDKDSYDLIASGDMGCIFQLGTSGGTIDLCKKMKPQNIEDISAINAICRPALKEFRDPFIKTKHGDLKIKLLHPLLERSMAKTYGFALYEESLLFLAQDLAGWDLNEADRLRKMTKDKGKYPEKVKALREEFTKDCASNGLDNKLVDKIWDEVIENYSKYGFNKSHGILYSMISYRTAYLKSHFPVEFLLANLMKESEGTSLDRDSNLLEIKNELRSKGIRVLPPNLNKSQMEFTLLDDQNIITGFNSLKSVGDDAIQDIIDKRPFQSFQDFMIRVDSKKVRANTIQALAASGVFSEFGLTRKQICGHVSDYRKKLTAWLKKHDPNKESFVYPWKDNSEWNATEIYALENKFMGESFSVGNKVAFKELVKIPHSTIKQVDQAENKSKIGSMSGLFSKPFEITIKKEGKLQGKKMYKFNFEDFTGASCSMTVFPDSAEKMFKWIKTKTKKQELPDVFGMTFSATVNHYNEQFGLVLNDIYGLELPPSLPDDFKVKKDVKTSEITTESLSEIEEELFNEGIVLY